MENASVEIRKVDLEQVSRCIAVCFAANVPCALWGKVGIGKSSLVQQVTKQMEWPLYDIRLSDKEPSDLGGIPIPNHDKQRVRYYMPELLPFEEHIGDKPAVILWDEYDRSDMDVQNVTLQGVLDRQINGHKFGPNVRQVIAGNGSSDVGTTELSSAAANRMLHLYIDNHSEGALDSFLKWGEDTGQPNELLSFARYNRTVFDGDPEQDRAFRELAIPTRRSWVMAANIWRTIQSMKFETKDILSPLIAGCVGSAGAASFLGWCNLMKDAPTLEEIVANPDTAKLPKDLSTVFALGQTIVSYAKEHSEKAEPMVAYVSRFPREQASGVFNKFLKAVPTISTMKPYRDWVNNTVAA